MVNRVYLSLSVLALVLSLWCEWSRVRTLARIGKSRQQGPRSSRGRNLS